MRLVNHRTRVPASLPALQPRKTPSLIPSLPLGHYQSARKRKPAGPVADASRWLPKEAFYLDVEGIEHRPITLPPPLNAGKFELLNLTVELKKVNPADLKKRFLSEKKQNDGFFITVDRNTFLFTLFDAIIVDFRSRFLHILNLYMEAISEATPALQPAAERHFEIALGQLYTACTAVNPGVEINFILRAFYRESRTIPKIRMDFIFPRANLIEIFSSLGVLTQPQKTFIGEQMAYIRKGLDETVIGQDPAKKSILDPFLLAVRGIEQNRKGRPIRVLLWLGGSGVGKSSLAKAAAIHLFGSEDAMHTVRGPEISMEHQITKLVGASATWVGYGEDIGFFEWHHRNNGTGILFVDEFSAASRAFCDLLITMAGEDGVLENGAGTEFAPTKNLIIILADNLGNTEVEKLAQRMGFSSGNKHQGVFDVPEETRQEIVENCLSDFPTQFRTRIDETVVFHPLTPEIQTAIIRSALKNALDEVREKLPFPVDFSPAVVTHLVALAFEEAKASTSEIAARDLKRKIDELVILPLIKMDLKNEVPGQARVAIRLKGRGQNQTIVFEVVNRAKKDQQAENTNPAADDFRPGNPPI